MLVAGRRYCLRPGLGEPLEHDRDADGPGVEGPDAALARVGGPAALGEHRPGGLRRLLGGLGRRRASAAPAVVARAQALLQDVDRGHERVEQRLVADVGLAALLDALDRGPQHGHDLVGADPVRAARGAPGAQEGRAPDGPRGAADAAGDDHRHLPQEGRDVRPVEVVPVGEHDLEAARERVPEVAVAHHRVELAEVRLVVDGRLGHRPHHQLDLLEARLRHSPASSCAAGPVVRSRGRPRGRPLSPSRRGSRPAPVRQHPGALAAGVAQGGHDRAPPRRSPRRSV